MLSIAQKAIDFHLKKRILIQLESDNEGQMVAESWLITVALKGTERALATILRLVLKKKRGIVDICGIYLIT